MAGGCCYAEVSDTRQAKGDANEDDRIVDSNDWRDDMQKDHGDSAINEGKYERNDDECAIH
jgi:hypothetical protein